MVVALIVEIVWVFLPDVQKPLLVKAIICFSPYTNLRAIAKTIDSNAAGQIGCLNGMRFVSSYYVMCFYQKQILSILELYQCPGSFCATVIHSLQGHLVKIPNGLGM